ncbi:hypothetical protein JW905_03375 [bacterium]|nr:hypothetical protein [candidate division CSSED10-310 bacterium]
MIHRRRMVLCMGVVMLATMAVRTAQGARLGLSAGLSVWYANWSFESGNQFDYDAVPVLGGSLGIDYGRLYSYVMYHQGDRYELDERDASRRDVDLYAGCRIWGSLCAEAGLKYYEYDEEWSGEKLGDEDAMIPSLGLRWQHEHLKSHIFYHVSMLYSPFASWSSTLLLPDGSSRDISDTDPWYAVNAGIGYHFRAFGFKPMLEYSYQVLDRSETDRGRIDETFHGFRLRLVYRFVI